MTGCVPGYPSVTCLQDSNLTTEPKKMPECVYLGHLIGDGRVKPFSKINLKSQQQKSTFVHFWDLLAITEAQYATTAALLT